MRRRIGILTAVLAAAPVLAADHSSRTTSDAIPIGAHVIVEDTRVRPEVLIPAMNLAERIFRQIGVRLYWTSGALPVVSPCGARRPEQIVIRLTDAPHLTGSADALGVARPFARDGVRVTVFSADVRAASHRNPWLEAAILGHVLAHEIGHVLQGTDRHSDSGIMRAHWRSRDLDAMNIETMFFTASDADELRTAISDRRASACLEDARHPAPSQ